MAGIDVRAAVDDSWRGRQAGAYFPSAWLGRLSIEEGYRVQLRLLDRLIEQGDRLLGWKVGLTAVAMQQQYGVHEPVFGYLLASGRRASGAELRAADLIVPGFENELCLTLGADLRGPGVDEAAARRAIAAIQPALEITGVRGPLREHLAMATGDNVRACQSIAPSATSFTAVEMWAASTAWR